MVSMKEIAAECGVSIATVSKALNDHRDVGEATKSRIRSVAKQKGYLPNAQARALKTNRTRNLGVLFIDEAHSGLTHDYFAMVLESFKRMVEERGYDITFINNSQKGRNGLSILEHCRCRGFDGVVIACVDFTDPQVEELVYSGLPVVTIDHLFEGKAAVLSDNVTGMGDLLRYIYGQGHRRIAYLHGERESSVTKSRVEAFLETARELGLEIPAEYLDEAPYRDIREAGEATRRLLDLKDPPTCILYPDDYACFGGINAIREQGLRVPEDISVAGYDGIRIAMHLEPRLTTVCQDMEAIGRAAGERLMELIEQPEKGSEEPGVIPGQVYPGETVSPWKE